MNQRGWILGLSGVLLLAGCGTNYGEIEPPKTYPVQGKVVLASGEPLRSGRIILHPQRPEGREAVADIEPGGSFTLTSFNKGDGAMPGEYVVTFDPYSYKTGKPQLNKQIPRRYWEKETSDLVVEVKAEENVLTITLRR